MIAAAMRGFSLCLSKMCLEGAETIRVPNFQRLCDLTSILHTVRVLAESREQAWTF